MPYIDSKVSVKMSKEQEVEIKSRLGKAIELIPGKSEARLMLGFQDEYHLYFHGDDSEATAFIEVSVYGNENKPGFNSLTGAICDIYHEVLNISPQRIYIKYNAVTTWGNNGKNM